MVSKNFQSTLDQSWLSFISRTILNSLSIELIIESADTSVLSRLSYITSCRSLRMSFQSINATLHRYSHYFQISEEETVETTENVRNLNLYIVFYDPCQDSVLFEQHALMLRKVITRSSPIVFVSSIVFFSQYISHIDNSLLVVLFLSGFVDSILRLWRNYLLYTFVDIKITLSSDFTMSSWTESETIPHPSTAKNHRFVSVFVTSRKRRPPFVIQQKMSDKIGNSLAVIFVTYRTRTAVKLHVFVVFATRSHIIVFFKNWFLTTRQTK